MIDTSANIRQLTAAIILQAVKDAVAGETRIRQEARIWLRGAECLYYCEFIGMDHNLICDWVRGGSKPLNRKAFLEAYNER